MYKGKNALIIINMMSYSFINFMCDFIIGYFEFLGKELCECLIQTSPFFQNKIEFEQITDIWKPKESNDENRFKISIENLILDQLFSENSIAFQEFQICLVFNRMDKPILDFQLQKNLEKEPMDSQFRKEMIDRMKKILKSFEKSKNYKNRVEEFLPEKEMKSFLQKQEESKEILDRYVQELNTRSGSSFTLQERLNQFYHDLKNEKILPHNFITNEDWEKVLNNVIFHFSQKYILKELENEMIFKEWFLYGLDLWIPQKIYQSEFNLFQLIENTEFVTKDNHEKVSNESSFNQFAIDLCLKLSESRNVNIFFSPFSIFSIFTIVYEGTMEQTKAEMQNVFHFHDIEILRKRFVVFFNFLKEEHKPYILKMGNAVWAQEGFPLLEQYINIVNNYYHAKVENVDFRIDIEKTRQKINSYIEDQTHGKIKNLIPPGVIHAAIHLIITNAIYFHGDWIFSFDSSKTMLRDFYLSSEEKIKVPVMYMKSKAFNYLKSETVEILELPYKGDDISMLILLPTEDITTLESMLNDGILKEWKSRMKKTLLDEIFLPRFTINSEFVLNEALKSMGLITAFTSEANFKKMSKIHPLWIDKVIHQAFISVDEIGTEAAAATALSIIGGFYKKQIFNANHPFLFIIQDQKTGNILFMGKMIDPTK